MWTESKVKQVLRKAGYKNIGHGTYINEVGHKIYLHKWVNGREYWREIAESQKLPPPPRVVATAGGPWWQIEKISHDGGKIIRFRQLPQEIDIETAGEIAQAILDMVANDD